MQREDIPFEPGYGSRPRRHDRRACMGKTVLLSLLFSALMQAQQGNPVTMTFNAVGSAALAGAGASFTLDGTATVTGLGTAPFFASGSVANLNSLGVAGKVSGTYVIIYPNGDVLTGQVSIPPGFVVQAIGVPVGATGSMTVTGGTGSFAGASGSFPIVTGMGTATGQFSSNLQASGSGSFKAPAFRSAGTLSQAGSLAHVAAGGGWKTTVIALNNGTTAAQARVGFFDESGSPLTLPLTFPQGGAAMSASAVTQTIRAGGELIIESQGDENTLTQGSAQLFTDGSVTAFLVFRYNPSGQEASVPLETQNAASYTIPFDNTAGLATGVALANVAAQPAAIPVVIRDDTGASVATDTIRLPSQGHISFIVAGRYSQTAGIRGSLEFQTPAGGQINALAIRAAASGAYTTIPAILK